MKIVFFLFFFMTTIPDLLALSNCKNWNKKWSVCQKDSECVVISNPCGWPVSAANKTYSVEALKCNRIAGSVLSCPSWDEKEDRKRVTRCLAGICVNQ